MTTLIQCVDSKRNGKHPARDLYCGNYFSAMRRYAIARGEPWFILSAKHGLLHPNIEIEPYDEFGLSKGQCKEIADQLRQKGIERVYVTAGKIYTDILTPELEHRGIDVIEVARGLKIGERVSLLQQKARKLENHELC